ncbi:MAG: helix-turn-helix domain-containing protein [Clostridia bacterium]|nr:helix-turn-helix domain-containing protein [Clostridia bacterium]
MAVKSYDHIRQALADLLFQQRERGFVHNSLDAEMFPFSLMKQGDMEGVRLCQENFTGNRGGKTSQNPLRMKQYGFVSTVTILCRVCIEGGMESAVSYGLSDLYIQQADQCTSIDALFELHERMLRDYTQRMGEIVKSNTYSAHVVRTMEYVEQHLQESIHIPDVALALGISVSHLSHTFSQETGLDLSAYIRGKRLEAAKMLLRHSDFTCTEIAEYFSFSSSAHFSKAFREHTGMTPTQYRRKRFHQVPISSTRKIVSTEE